MAIGDYILCCKCEVKLIYDGDRPTNREWWKERFGGEPEIECPNCKPKREWVGLTQEQKNILCEMSSIDAAICAADLILKEKNGIGDKA